MPLYEYSCNQCSKIFEELIFREEAPVSCPHCGFDRTTRVLSACRFKTGGPIVTGSPSSNAVTTRGSSPCAGCSGGDCSSC